MYFRSLSCRAPVRATAFAPILFGRLVQARHDVARQLVEVEEAREHERALYAQTVLARERAQLAREMHDVVSHQVSLIAVQAGALQVAAKDPDARDAARTIRTLSVNTLDDRSASHFTPQANENSLANQRNEGDATS